MSNTDPADQLLANAADDYANATSQPEASFQKLADTARQDRAVEAAENRRAAR